MLEFDQGHGLAADKNEAASIALNADCNLNCGNTYRALVAAIKAGLTTEEEVGNNLSQLLPTRFILGLFDPIGTVPFDPISKMLCTVMTISI